jgi:hypothetical protein
LKKVYKESQHYQQPNTAKFRFFIRHPPDKTGEITASEITRNKNSLRACLEASPCHVLPVSFLGESITTVDGFFRNSLTRGKSQAQVCQSNMLDAVVGCGLLKFKSVDGFESKQIVL